MKKNTYMHIENVNFNLDNSKKNIVSHAGNNISLLEFFKKEKMSRICRKT